MKTGNLIFESAAPLYISTGGVFRVFCDFVVRLFREIRGIRGVLFARVKGFEGEVR
jgi:hypothetical protein